MNTNEQSQQQPEEEQKNLPQITQFQPTEKKSFPPITSFINVFDFQEGAKEKLSKEAWDYFSSGANDEITVFFHKNQLRENELAFQRIWIKPRYLRNVKTVSSQTTIFNIPSSFPCYISATSLTILAHDDGELALMRAANNENVIYMVPTLASMNLDKIYKEKKPEQSIFFQLYINKDRRVTVDLIKKAEEAGAKAIVLTVDSPFFGKRERDMRRYATVQSHIQKEIGQKVDKSKGVSQVVNQFLDCTADWETLKWLMGQTHLPFILKGIQTVEDAILAYNHGVKAIIISNHGGRQLDFARPSIEVLEDVMIAFQKYGIKGKIEVYIDGGIRRGIDIYKAIALGAKAVGIGRPVLYGLGAFGQEGVEKVLQILKAELEMCMRLSGARSIEEITPEMCCTKDLSTHTVETPHSFLTVDIYEPLKHASKL